MDIEALINQSGFKRKRIAKTMGVSESALSLKISGRRRFTTHEIKQIATILDIPFRMVLTAVQNLPKTRRYL